jgi:hypothetical protein
MYTSVVLTALAGSLVASLQTDGVGWQSDYTLAREMAKTANKPLAVFIGTGGDGAALVCRDGKLSPEIQKTLLDSFICLYADVSTEAGKKLAADFGNGRGLGLVLSNRSGDLQSFSHEGDLSAADLSRWLAYGADPNLVVRTTMNNSVGRVSMYPPGTSILAPGTRYVSSNYSGGLFFGAACPGGT